MIYERERIPNDLLLQVLPAVANWMSRNSHEEVDLIGFVEYNLDCTGKDALVWLQTNATTNPKIIGSFKILDWTCDDI
jgi:hypothetical protein